MIASAITQQYLALEGRLSAIAMAAAINSDVMPIGYRNIGNDFERKNMLSHCKPSSDPIATMAILWVAKPQVSPRQRVDLHQQDWRFCGRDCALKQ